MSHGFSSSNVSSTSKTCANSAIFSGSSMIHCPCAVRLEKMILDALSRPRFCVRFVGFGCGSGSGDGGKRSGGGSAAKYGDIRLSIAGGIAP